VQTGLAPGSSAIVVDYSAPCESAEVRMLPYMSIEEAFIYAWQLPGLPRAHTHTHTDTCPKVEDYHLPICSLRDTAEVAWSRTCNVLLNPWPRLAESLKTTCSCEPVELCNCSKSPRPVKLMNPNLPRIFRGPWRHSWWALSRNLLWATIQMVALGMLLSHVVSTVDVFFGPSFTSKADCE
jgi:hypothetical protein